MRNVGAVLGGCGIFGAVIVGIIVLSVGGFAFNMAWRYYTADIKGRVDAQEQRLSGDARLSAYNHFFNLCASVQTNEAQLDALYAEQQTATDPDDKARVAANITGVSAARAGAINQYNADAAKDYTQGQFRDLDLPYRLGVFAYPSGGKTTCAAQ